MTHYHVGFRQPGFEPAGEVRTFTERDSAVAQNKINASHAFAALSEDVEWDESWNVVHDDQLETDGYYSVWLTLVGLGGEDRFTWDYYAEACDEQCE